MKITMLRRLGITGAAFALLSLGLAAPAFASGPSGSVSATLVIPQSLSLTLGTSSLAFTGTPGGPSNVTTVTYSMASDDSAGYQLQVSAASPNMTSPGGGSFPVSMISVWSMGMAAPAGQCSPGPVGPGCLEAAPVSTTPMVTASSSTVSAAAGDNGYDDFAFLGSGWTGTGPGGASLAGSSIPANVPAGTYQDTINYVLIGN